MAATLESNASRLSHLSSDAERARRYAALREAMAGAGMDAFVVCGRGDEFVRGRLQYVSDAFNWAGWAFVVLPLKGEATYVGDPLWGTSRAAEAGWITDYRLTQTPGEELAGILSDHGLQRGRIGLVGSEDGGSYRHVRALQESLPHATFEDAGDLFEDVRIVKSAEEIENLRQTSAILRTVYGAVAAELRPHVTERDALAEAHRLCRQFGCLDGIAIIGRPPFRIFGAGSDAQIQRDDVIVLDIEQAGPSGYWLELRRCYSFGEPTAEVREFFEMRRACYQACVEAIRPGASSEDIIRARDEAYAAHGYPPATSLRYSAHGIGLDSLEAPWVPGKERVLKEGMVLSLHPDVLIEDEAKRARLGGVSIADNVLVTADGAECLTDEAIDWQVLVNC